MRSVLSKSIFLIVMLLGLVVMIGWFTDSQALKSILPNVVTMKFTTALSFFAAGISGFLLVMKRRSIATGSIMGGFSFIIFSVMMGLMIEQLAGVRFNIENTFVQEAGGAVFSTVPGLPSIATMVAFLIFVLVIWHEILTDKSQKLRFVIGQALMFIGVWAIGGYIANEPWMYYYIEGKSTAMAIHTAIGFFALGGGLVLSNNAKISLLQSRIEKRIQDTRKFYQIIMSVILFVLITIVFLYARNIEKRVQEDVSTAVNTWFDEHELYVIDDCVCHEQEE